MSAFKRSHFDKSLKTLEKHQFSTEDEHKLAILSVGVHGIINIEFKEML